MQVEVAAVAKMLAVLIESIEWCVGPAVCLC
jgi:hypothetical protein